MSQKFKCLKKKIDRGKYMAKEPYGNINLDLIREMSEAHGISGCEKEVSRVMKKDMALICDEITYDHLGSIIGLKKGHLGPKIMIAGHMDEVGFLVRDIDENGFMPFILLIPFSKTKDD